jgi:hypothetical protein
VQEGPGLKNGRPTDPLETSPKPAPPPSPPPVPRDPSDGANPVQPAPSQSQHAPLRTYTPRNLRPKAHSGHAAPLPPEAPRVPRGFMRPIARTSCLPHPKPNPAPPSPSALPARPLPPRTVPARPLPATTLPARTVPARSVQARPLPPRTMAVVTLSRIIALRAAHFVFMALSRERQNHYAAGCGSQQSV